MARADEPHPRTRPCAEWPTVRAGHGRGLTPAVSPADTPRGATVLTDGVRQGGLVEPDPGRPHEPGEDDLAARELEALGLVVGELRLEAGAVRADELRPHLEPEMRDALDEHLLGAVLREGRERDVV